MPDQHSAGTPEWWITTDLLHRGGEKVLGPFISQDLAVKVRTYLEKVEGHENFWIDQEATRVW